ncbi:MAG TPA: pectate lyase [Gemmatimonadaceae bacterium]|nr:pectate lyase [Gemmatimonadaceae bacterium]
MGVGRGARGVVVLLAVSTIAMPVKGQATPRAELLSPARLDALPAAQRDAWTRYVARSRQLDSVNRAFMENELRQAGATTMRKATYARGFDVTPAMTDAWFRSDSARRLGESLLTYQTPAGGWAKRTDFSRPRQPGESWYAESAEWHYIGTIDNGSTTAQLRFLARLAAAHDEPRLRDAYLRGLAYLVDAQYPNGCWPQVYPLQGGYSDAATFNDDAIVNVLEVLGDAARGAVPFVPAALRERAASAVRGGRDCLVATQVVVNGVRTVWGQQHDPLTLAPIKARSYELAGLSGRESAQILTYLLSLPDPTPREVEAIHAAAAYFERTKIHGYAYSFDTGLREQPGAGPIWARLREVETNRPIFANRDGVTIYDWNQLTDRRTGYAWYGTEPGSALQKYAKWVRAREKAGARSDTTLPVRKQP